jgi:hypothetical protein
MSCSSRSAASVSSSTITAHASINGIRAIKNFPFAEKEGSIPKWFHTGYADLPIDSAESTGSSAIAIIFHHQKIFLRRTVI